MFNLENSQSMLNIAAMVQMAPGSLLVGLEKDRISKGGIALPDAALTVPVIKAQVVARGPGKRLDTPVIQSNGELYTHHKHLYSIGTWIALSPHAGREIRINEEMYLIVQEHEVWMTLKDPEAFG